MAERTNEEWLRGLRGAGAPRDQALSDLRRFLIGALPRGLRRYGFLPLPFFEDVAQDALLRILDRLDSYEGRSRFTTWAMAVAVRIAVTELRRRRWKDLSLEDVEENAPLLGEWSADGAATPEDHSAQREILHKMAEVLESQLSKRQRSVLVAELQGMPLEDIGSQLGINRNAVYKLGHDARKKLQRGLEAAGFRAADIRAAFSQDHA